MRFLGLYVVRVVNRSSEFHDHNLKKFQFFSIRRKLQIMFRASVAIGLICIVSCKEKKSHSTDEGKLIHSKFEIAKSKNDLSLLCGDWIKEDVKINHSEVEDEKYADRYKLPQTIKVSQALEFEKYGPAIQVPALTGESVVMSLSKNNESYMATNSVKRLLFVPSEKGFYLKILMITDYTQPDVVWKVVAQYQKKKK